MKLSEVQKPMKLSDVVSQQPMRLSSVTSNPSVIQNILQHPFQAILNPASKTITGKTLEEKWFENERPTYIKPNSPLDYWSAVARNATGGISGAVADVATTPASYIPIPVGKVLSKIPLGKTTLGKIMETPVGGGFIDRVNRGLSGKTATRLSEITRPENLKTAEEYVASKGADRKIIDGKLPNEDIARYNDDGTIIVDKDKFYSHSKADQADILAHEEAHSVAEKIIANSDEFWKFVDNKEYMKYRGRNAVEKITNMIQDGKLPKEIADKFPDLPKTKSQLIAEWEAKASQNPPQLISPVQKLMNALDEAKISAQEQEQIYHAQRAIKFAKADAARSSMTGKASFYAQLKELKGAFDKVQFKPLTEMLNDNDVNALFDIIQKATPNLGDSLSAGNGFIRMLEGKVPRPSEIAKLQEIFPKEVIDKLLENRSLLEKFKDTTFEVLNIPRAIMATLDMSAPLRQGIFMIGKPKQFVPAFRDMFKYFFNEKAYDGLLAEIKKRPTYDLMRKARVSFSDVHSRLASREEKFASSILERHPLTRWNVGIPMRASSRAYSGFLDKLRADVFDDLVGKATAINGELSDKLLKDIGSFVNAATGRGHFPSDLGNASQAMNAIFFSPRLIASRVQLMNPQYYISLDPMVRKEALKSLITLAGTASSVLGLASAGGAKVGTDPRSADFGKIKIGNTRYDVLGGFQQYIRFAAQLVTGERISSTTGVKTTVGEGYKPESRWDIALRFLQTKESPTASLITELMQGKDFSGAPLNAPDALFRRFVPMVMQDMIDLYKDNGPGGLAMDIPAVFGVGVQNYSPDAEEMVHSARSTIKYAKKLFSEGKTAEGQRMMEDNAEVIRIGGRLNGFQEGINKMNSELNKIKLNSRLLPEKKDQLEKLYNSRIRDLKARMEQEYEKIKAENAKTNK